MMNTLPLVIPEQIEPYDSMVHTIKNILSILCTKIPDDKCKCI